MGAVSKEQQEIIDKAFDPMGGKEELNVVVHKVSTGEIVFDVTTKTLMVMAEEIGEEEGHVGVHVMKHGNRMKLRTFLEEAADHMDDEMRAEMFPNGNIKAVLDGLFGSLFGGSHDCENCAGYDDCDLDFKKPRTV